MSIDLILRYLILLCLPLASRDLWGCSCEESALAFHPIEAFEKADMVFLGKVEDLKHFTKNGKKIKRASFRILRSWKGISGPSLQLETEDSMCGSHFTLGETYLQYGYKDFRKNNVCNGTMVEGAAKGRILDLDKSLNQRDELLRKRPPETSVLMKGLELYSWTDHGKTRYALLPGTNRLKKIEEILNFEQTFDIEALLTQLKNIPAGTVIAIEGGAGLLPNIELLAPPEADLKRIVEECVSHSLKCFKSKQKKSL